MMQRVAGEREVDERAFVLVRQKPGVPDLDVVDTERLDSAAQRRSHRGRDVNRDDESTARGRRDREQPGAATKVDQRRSRAEAVLPKQSDIGSRVDSRLAVVT